MLSHLRDSFNSSFTDEKYSRLLKRMDALCGAHVEFRISETPVFLPTPLVERMERSGREIILQLVSDTVYLEKSARVIPKGFHVPRPSDHPLFAAVDFGIARDENGEYVPKLIELQGFPTMFVYQSVLSQQYKEIYDLPRRLTSYMGGLTTDGYLELLRASILGSHDPEEVVLMELDPMQQKTRVDFILTERTCGIHTVNIRDIVKKGTRLFRRENGSLLPIRRIYNRAIVDDLLKSGAPLPFRFDEELDVEWAGHPNWFYQISKFSIPFLDHPDVPRTSFLANMESYPEHLERWVLKPLFSFAGSGVKVGPTKDDIEAVPRSDRSNYVLQERVEYAGAVRSPNGPTMVEVRMMYVWSEDGPRAVNNLVRMGRGKMMGVDHNKNMPWVGSSAGFHIP